jgi:ribosome biogenesis GTPase A
VDWNHLISLVDKVHKVTVLNDSEIVDEENNERNNNLDSDTDADADADADSDSDPDADCTMNSIASGLSECDRLAHQCSSSTQLITIGLVGHPNVGKSTIVNSIVGRSVVSVSKTPGHTKHFQTIHLTSSVRLCDCPGLVFPAVLPKPLQVCSFRVSFKIWCYTNKVDRL